MVLLAICLLIMILFYTRPVEVLGNSIKILFVHVPSAWISVLSFFLGLYYSIRYLLTKNLYYSKMAFNSSLLGIVLIITATVTGAIWAKIAWNSFWNGDVRQTTIIMLLLIYSAYFAIYFSFSNFANS